MYIIQLTPFAASLNHIYVLGINMLECILNPVRWCLQEEAALRLTQVAPGASDFRVMSIETQYYSQATPLFSVSKTEFSPVPDVNGLVVDFNLHLPEDRAIADAEGFLAMVGRLHKAQQSSFQCFLI